MRIHTHIYAGCLQSEAVCTWWADGGNTIECLSTFEDPVEERTFAQLLTQKLSHPSVGLVDGTLVEVLDESQGDFKMKMKITHRCCILICNVT